MNTLRGTLLRNSLAMVAVLVSVTLLLVAVYATTLRQEQRFGDVILLEQGLMNRASDMVRAFNEFRNSPVAEQKTRYTTAREQLAADVQLIGALMFQGKNRIAYDGLANTIQTLTGTIEAGVGAVERSDVSAATSAYEESNAILTYLPDTVSHLLSEELEVTRDARSQIAQRQQLVLFASGALLIIVIISVVLSALKLARRVSRPIEELARLSHKIADGSYDVTIEPWVTEGHDEIAVLAAAFDAMSEHLRDTIVGLQKTNEQLASTRDQLSGQNTLLEKLNKLFISREQRIHDLKAELRAAGRAVSDSEDDEVDSSLKGV